MTPDNAPLDVEFAEYGDYYVIATVARVAGIDPRTVRRYERAGILQTRRGPGDVPLYSSQDIEELRRIQRLTRELGLNLEAIDVILHMRRQILALQGELAALRGDQAI